MCTVRINLNESVSSPSSHSLLSGSKLLLSNMNGLSSLQLLRSMSSLGRKCAW